MTVKFYLIYNSNYTYIQILPYNSNLSANPVQPVFLLLPPALLTLSLLRFVKLFAGVYRASAHVENFIYSSE